jgi:hypothetical protein
LKNVGYASSVPVFLGPEHVEPEHVENVLHAVFQQAVKELRRGRENLFVFGHIEAL